MILIKLLLSVLPVISEHSIEYGERKDYAVFFHVSDFKDSGWNQLPETGIETKRIAKELEDNYGFEVKIISNPTKSEILKQIRILNKRNFGNYDQLLLFFSTHGYYDESLEEGFLIPVDGLSKDTYGDSWISYRELGLNIGKSQCKHILLAIDACYSGSFGDRYRGMPKNIPASSGLDCVKKIEQSLQYKSRLFFTSGGRTQRTPARSLFAKQWLKALRSGERTGIISVEDLRFHMQKVDHPRPESGSFAIGHDPAGDFLFVHKSACSEEELQTEDEQHWRKLQDQSFKYELALEHLKNFPGCVHHTLALAEITRHNEMIGALESQIEDGQLQKKLTLAMEMRIDSVVSYGVKKRKSGKYVAKNNAKNIDAVQCCFKLRENLFIEPGQKEFIIRILDPGGGVEIFADELSFYFLHRKTGEILQASSFRIIPFPISDVYCANLDLDELGSLATGPHKVEIFYQEVLCGEGVFLLK